MNPRNFFSELKRRNVVRAGGLYLVGAWLLTQVASTVLPMFGAPDWLPRSIVILLVIGFIPALIFSWAFELTPQGLTRDAEVPPEQSITSRAGRRMDRLIIAVLVLALGYFAFDKFVLTPRREAALRANESKSITDKLSIAVLPFVNMSADKNDEYLSDGVSEELIATLSKIAALQVKARTSSFAFKGKNEDIQKIGELLHVSHLLEGSVAKAGNKLRITAQLIQASDGNHLWSDTYDREMQDIFAMRTEVAQQVAEILKIRLLGEDKTKLDKKPTENPEAYRLYLLGRYYLTRFTQEGWSKAIDYYNQALQVDPNYALAYCGLADTYSSMGGLTMPGKEAWAREKELAQKALAFDPNLADAHLSLGLALAASFDWKAGESEIKRAIEINPNLALAYDQYAWVLTVFGRFDEALAKERKALELDPLSPFMNVNLGAWLYGARQYDEAIAQLRRTFEFNPNSALAHFMLGWCLLGKGTAADAIGEFEKAKALDDLPMYDGALGYAYAISRNRAKAEQVLDRLEDVSKQRYVSPGPRVYVYLGLGDREKLYEWLEKGYEERDWSCFWLKVDPIFDRLRNEARFQALVRKVGLDQ